MSPSKFRSVTGVTETSPEYVSDYEQASTFDHVRVGKLGIYYREGFHLHLIPYSYPERVFIRVQEVKARVGCCSNSLFYCKLVFCKDGKEFASILSEKEAEMDKALSEIVRRAPQIQIGFPHK